MNVQLKVGIIPGLELEKQALKHNVFLPQERDGYSDTISLLTQLLQSEFLGNKSLGGEPGVNFTTSRQREGTFDAKHGRRRSMLDVRLFNGSITNANGEPLSKNWEDNIRDLFNCSDASCFNISGNRQESHSTESTGICTQTHEYINFKRRSEVLSIAQSIVNTLIAPVGVIMAIVASCVAVAR